MTWFSGILVFVIAWWLFFFMSLPFGVKSQQEAGDDIVPGTVESAPRRPYLWRKALVATVLAALFLLFFDWLLASDLVALRPAPGARPG